MKQGNSLVIFLFVLNVLLFLFWATNVGAELVWKSDTIKIEADLDQTAAEVEFFFHNNGSQTVVIDKVKTSCDCTTANLDKKTVGSNESGSVKGFFSFGSREGLQTKTYEVVYANGNSDILTLTVDIPRLYKFSSRRLVWGENEIPSTAKSATLKNVSGEPLRIVSAHASNSSFEVELIELNAGFEYEVQVTPNEIANPSLAIISLVAESKFGQRRKSFKIYASTL